MNRLAVIVVAVIVFGFSLGWALGTFRLPPQQAGAEVATAPCAIALSGSNTIGERLAPEIVTAFFTSAGYVVSDAAQVAPDEIRISATRGAQRCVIDIRSHGSSFAFRDLASGAASIGMASRALKPEEAAALAAAGAGDFAADAALAEHVIALDGIAVIVHPESRLHALSRRDVRRVFVGDVSDWRSLGGPSGAIARYARDDESGTFQFFLEHVLENDPHWAAAQAGVRRFASSTALTSAVAADRNAIGFVGAAYVTPAVRALAISDGGQAFPPTPGDVRAESYPISRRLFLYVRPQVMRADPRVAALVTFFKSAAAFALVERLGFVSLAAAGREAGAPLQCSSETPEARVYRVAAAGAERLPMVIRFLPGSNIADSLARDDLARAAAPIRAALADNRTVTLIGHSDAEGEAEINRMLAQRRAESIRGELEGLGAMGLQVESAGEACPVAGNDTPQGRQSNRRVEIWISARS